MPAQGTGRGLGRSAGGVWGGGGGGRTRTDLKGGEGGGLHTNNWSLLEPTLAGLV